MLDHSLADLDKSEITKEAKRWLLNNQTLEMDNSSFYDSPRISSEIPDCSMPLTADTYKFCHPPGTKIMMAGDVEKNIEDVKVGDLILSFAIESNKIETDEVEETFIHEGKELFEIETDEGTILRLSPEHPIFVKGRGWVIAAELTTADTILMIE